MDPDAHVERPVGGARSQGVDHGDPVGRDTSVLHALEGDQGVAGTAAVGVASDEGGPGDDLAGGHFVEQALAGGHVAAASVEVEEGVADVVVGGEARPEGEGVDHAAPGEVGKGLEDDGEGVVVGGDGGADHVGEDEEGRRSGARGGDQEGGSEEGVAEKDVGAAEAGEEGEGGGETAEGEAGVDEGGGDGGVGVEAVEEDLGQDAGEVGGRGARAKGVQDAVGGGGQLLPP